MAALAGVVVEEVLAAVVVAGGWDEAEEPHVRRKEITGVMSHTTPREKMVVAADVARGGVVVEKESSSR